MSEIKRNADQIIIKPGKDIVASMANEFRSELHAIVQEAPQELIIDLAGVDMVDSVGIGVLIATHNSLTRGGAFLRVLNVSEEIYKLFNTMRLDRHFTVKRSQQA